MHGGEHYVDVTVRLRLRQRKVTRNMVATQRQSYLELMCDQMLSRSKDAASSWYYDIVDANVEESLGPAV